MRAGDIFIYIVSMSLLRVGRIAVACDMLGEHFVSSVFLFV